MYNLYSGYNPFQPPAPPVPQMRVTRVSGRPGAEAFQMGPNSEVVLLDETQPVIWLKTTDGAGYPSLSPFDISPHEDEKPVDYKSFDERLKRLEDYINAQSDAGKA